MAYVVRNGKIIMICDACGKEEITQMSEIVEHINPEVPDLCFECATEEYGDVTPCSTGSL